VSVAAAEKGRNITAQVCPNCFRSNPADAFYCHFDGFRLPGHSDAEDAARRGLRFPRPFVFGSGRTSNNFDELSLACQDLWEEARAALQQGILERFLGDLGRIDLAQAAANAARYPDIDRGLDQFLDALPSSVLSAAVLRVEPPEVNLGTLRRRQPRQLTIRLINEGQRLLHGVVVTNCDWLAFGSPTGDAEKSFACSGQLELSIHVRAHSLRALDRPLEATLTVKSSGGKASVVVRGTVPVQPFAAGYLAGARSPRELAEKIRAMPRETAVYLEDGSVAQWYRENGWTYPIQVPTARGLGAVQQFFEALGLTRPPRVEITPLTVVFRGPPGAPLHQVLQIQAQEKRALWVHGASDEHWLQVGPPRLDGAGGTLPLIVNAVPNQPGAALQARVKVTTNGNQRFLIPVTLLVESRDGVKLPPPPAAVAAPDWALLGAPSAAPSTVAPPTAVMPPAMLPAFSPPVPPPPPPMPAPTAIRTTVAPVATIVPTPPVPPALPAAGERRQTWLAAAPALVLALVLAGIITHDFLLQRGASPAAAMDDPLLALQFHEGKIGDALDALLPEPTMRFGIRMAEGKGAGGKGRRLTLDPWGRTNNTCLRIDGEENLLGSAAGAWVERAARTWEDARGGQHKGLKSIWQHKRTKVQVTQLVELVHGEESNRLDTCLVLYVLENPDQAAHAVGLRFLLDTFIGANDGVPFTIPGESQLCADSKDFTARVPAFIQALEREDLANPGTVAHLKLKLGDREPPSRVILGAWPDEGLSLLKNETKARGLNTGWEVPVFSMKTLYPYDSAVVLYWNEKPLPPAGRREVGFAYGLGNVASSGKLLLTVDGSFKPGGELTVTALVSDPAAGEKLTLSVPAGFVVEGEATQKVPEAAGETDTRNRPVTWKVKAGPVGAYDLAVESTSGAVQRKAVRIKESSIFD
jgi:hypothetical protein